MKFGVFDSGIGGVTVLQALRRRFPGHPFAYFGDTLHVPYGTKSATQIRALSASAAERIRGHGVEALVVACNTASSLALPEIQSAMGGVPVLGMVEAGVAAVRRAAALRAGPIAVFGTRATVRSGVYGASLRAALPDREIFEQACPLLVPIIEEGWLKHPVLDLTLREYAGPDSARAKEPGVALLACTHYPWIRDAFERALPGWVVVDSADATVQALEARFAGRSEFSASEASAAPPERVEWYFSDPEIARFIFDGEPDGAATKVEAF